MKAQAGSGLGRCRAEMAGMKNNYLLVLIVQALSKMVCKEYLIWYTGV
jgi:hypothetical protein